MEKLIESNIGLGKYMDTDIDEYTIFFSHNTESSLVDEYEIPKEYKYIVTTGTQKGKTFPDWISIANPEGLKKIIEKDNKCLPEIRFDFKNEEGITLIDFFKKYIFKMA